MAKDARNDRDEADDVLDVIDLLTDEPIPSGRRIEPEPDDADPRPPGKRRLILLGIAAVVIAIVGVSVIVTRDDGGPEGVGIASDDTNDETDASGARERPASTVPNVPAAVWRTLGGRFGLGIDTQVLLVDGTTGSVDSPRTLPNGAVRVLAGRGGALFVYAGDDPVVLDGDGRVTDGDDARIFPGAAGGLWWIAHERNLMPLIGTANTVVTPRGTHAVAAVRDGFILQDDQSGVLSLWTGGGEQRSFAPEEGFSLVAIHPDRVAWQGLCPGNACGVHVTEVASGRDVILPAGIVPLFEPGRAYGRFSPDGRYLATHVADRIDDSTDFVLVDLTNGSVVTRVEVAVRMPARGTTGVVEAVPFDFTADGQHVVVADWSQRSGRLIVLRTADGSREQTLDDIGRISSLAALDTQPTAPTTPLLPDGTATGLDTGATLALASGNDDFVTVDLDTGRQHTYTVPIGPPLSTSEFEPRLVALDGGFAWIRGGEAFFAAPDAEPLSLGPATYVMGGGTRDEGWTVLRTDDGYDLTRFDGTTGARGATYASSAAPEGAVRDGLVVGRPASFTRGSAIEIWNPVTGDARAITISARAPMVTAAGGTRIVWFDQSCSGARSSCGTRVTDVVSEETRELPENAYPFSASATTPTGDQLYVQVQEDTGQTRLASIDLATMQPTEVPDSDNVENWAASSKGVVVFARQGELRVWKTGWTESRLLSPGGFGLAIGVALR